MIKKLNLLILFCLILGFIVGYWFNHLHQKQSDNNLIKTDIRENGYQYINPLLECEYVQQLGNNQTKNLENKFQTIINQNESTDISVYYRDLKNGPWLGLNLNHHFAPQSLLKLPVMFAYYKLAEENPSILENELEYKGQELVEQNLIPDQNITPGQKYKIDYLIYRMIAYSDNAAFELLALSMPSDILKKVHSDLGIPYPKQQSETDFMTVKEYSSLFRVLYNSSYLTRHYSNLALLKLIDAKYDNGLKAGVPKKIEIADKFGVKQIKGEKAVQLHDCGIIYHQKNPYILCVMTKGNNITNQEKIISEISKTVYQEIDKKTD